MAKKTYHVTPDISGRWVVRLTGSDRAEGAFRTQREATGYAKTRARHVRTTEEVEIVIHKRDGRISSKDTYGSESKPPAEHKR